MMPRVYAARIIYAVIVEDSHSDVDVELFEHDGDAITWAGRFAYARAGEQYADQIDYRLTDPMISAGWIYYARYAPEGVVHVVEKRVTLSSVSVRGAVGDGTQLDQVFGQ